MNIVDVGGQRVPQINIKTVLTNSVNLLVTMAALSRV